MRTRLPTMHELMTDPVYRTYMKTMPPAHPANTHGKPWQLWLRRSDGVWMTKQYPTYREAWPVFVKHYRTMPDYPGLDITVTSRRVFYAPPGEWYRVKVRRPRRPTPADPSTSHVVIETRWRQTFHWDGVGLEWCGRCRRPTFWKALPSTHHALRRMPAVSTEDNERCVICGIRRVGQPHIDQMVRLG
jgi:hypothetical protein